VIGVTFSKPSTYMRQC